MARAKVYRIAEPGAHAVFLDGVLQVPNPNRPYREDDPLVINHPWLFISDEDTVEAAEAPPGVKRRVGRPPMARDAEGRPIR